jgi:hypothetical protein
MRAILVSYIVYFLRYHPVLFVVVKSRGPDPVSFQVVEVEGLDPRFLSPSSMLFTVIWQDLEIFQLAGFLSPRASLQKLPVTTELGNQALPYHPHRLLMHHYGL